MAVKKNTLRAVSTGDADNEAMADLDFIHDRVREAQACADAINVVLLGRIEHPEACHMSDHVLVGLASAAGALLRQADEELNPKGANHG